MNERGRVLWFTALEIPAASAVYTPGGDGSGTHGLFFLFSVHTQGSAFAYPAEVDGVKARLVRQERLKRCLVPDMPQGRRGASCRLRT